MELYKRFKIVINELPYNDYEIAKKLGISKNFISRLKNGYDKIKPLHYYALNSAYNIPIEIFENDKITENEILNLLRNNNKFITKTKKFNQKYLKLLQGKWYLYNYYSLDNYLYEDKLEINNLEIKHINEKKQFDYSGNIIEMNSQYTILKLYKENSQIYIIIYNRNLELEKNKLYAIMFGKSSYFNRDFTQFIILSKEKLSKDRAKVILGNRETIQMHINDRFLDRLNKDENKPTYYSNEDYFNFLKSKEWNLYFSNSSFNFIVAFNSISNIEFLKDGKILGRGKINFYGKYILLDFYTAANSDLTFMLFEKHYREDLILSIKSKRANDEDIVTLGFLSTKKFNKEEIDKILLPDLSYLNMTKTRLRLNKFLRERKN